MVVAEAGDGAEAVEMATRGEVDLAVLDIAMPRMTGLQAARELARRAPEVRLLMLSMYDNEQYFFEALKAGASGYVLKSVADRDLLEACRAAMRGEPFLYPGAVTALIRDYLQRIRRGEPVPDSMLTAREEEIVKLIAEGHSAKDIADTARDQHRRPWTGTAPTSCRSSGCGTVSTWPDTPSGPAWWSPEGYGLPIRRAGSRLVAHLSPLFSVQESE